MDLKSLAPKTDIVEVTIKHPTTEEVLKNEDGSEMVITLYAPHSTVYKDYRFEVTNEKLVDYQKKGKDFQIDAREIETDGINLLAAVTKSWNITYDGKQPKVTEKLARKVYDELFWIRPQLEEGLANSLDFTVA